MKKWIHSKKYLLIFAISFVVFLMLYGGSYWYLRTKTINMVEKIKKAPKGFIYIPSGYYLEIQYGVGLSNGSEPPRGAQTFTVWIDSKSKAHSAKWMGYLYYPLWRSEITIWRIKTFGWK
jgi:hypothetical protein